MGQTLGATGPVALTGATGFLGRAVLAELLDTTDVSIIGLVRARSAGEAEQRGWETLHSALDRHPTEEEQARCTWLRTDLEETRLGLAEEDWNRLATGIGDIIHCAASVEFDLELNEAQRINVDGTARLLELATKATGQGHFGCFHHVSTAYVSGRTAEKVDADHLPSDRAGNFRNNYERTKARAERLLRTQSTVPVAIYRPSIISGRTDTGRTDNWNVLYAPMRMLAKGQLPIMPASGRALVDAVGVDYVARGIVHLARSGRGSNVGHHLTAGDEPITVQQFVDVSVRVAKLFDREPSDTEVVSAAHWHALTAGLAVAARAPKRAAELRRWGRLGKRGLKGFAPYAPYTSVSTRFDNRRERLLLESAGIRMPKSGVYLETICSFAIGTDFGRSPIVSDVPVQCTSIGRGTP